MTIKKNYEIISISYFLKSLDFIISQLFFNFFIKLSRYFLISKIFF